MYMDRYRKLKTEQSLIKNQEINSEINDYNKESSNFNNLNKQENNINIQECNINIDNNKNNNKDKKMKNSDEIEPSKIIPLSINNSKYTENTSVIQLVKNDEGMNNININLQKCDSLNKIQNDSYLSQSDINEANESNSSLINSQNESEDQYSKKNNKNINNSKSMRLLIDNNNNNISSNSLHMNKNKSIKKGTLNNKKIYGNLILYKLCTNIN